MNLMNQFFCLSGYGYLHDIIKSGDKVIAKIIAFTHTDSTTLSRDEVWIECEVNDRNYQAQLQILLGYVQSGESVIINFTAQYGAFVNAYAGLAPEDPKHLVTLQAKLHELKDCYANGRLVQRDNTHWLQTAA